MKLNYTRQKASHHIVGAQAVIARNDVEGSSLAIHMADEIIVIRLDSLINFIKEQGVVDGETL